MAQVVLDAASASTGDFANSIISNTSTDALSMRLLNDTGVGSSLSQNSVDVKYEVKTEVNMEEVSKEEDDEDDDTEQSDEESGVERDANCLSKYELERLANIARNQDVLKSLGLAGEDKLSLKKTRTKTHKKRKREYDNNDDEPKVGWRRAARLAGKEAVYRELPPDFEDYDFEETYFRRSKSKREIKKAKTFAVEQGEENEANERKLDFKRSAAAAEKARQQEFARLWRQRQQQQQQQQQQNLQQQQMAQTSLIPLVSSNLLVDKGHKYFTSKPKIQCNVCGGMFTMKKGGGVAGHMCIR